MNKPFFYEHIGHMQFSTLTLQALIVLKQLTERSVGKFVSWDKARQLIIDCGFTSKQAEGELSRFCYGFECQEQFRNGQHELALTETGRLFIDRLLAEAFRQDSQLAILLRPARRKEHWNITVQESTFWPDELYQLIRQFKLRKGPARDFLKCLPTSAILEFLSAGASSLKPAPLKRSAATLDDCLQLVETHGQYWATVGGKYSWFVFPQRFELPSENKDWEKYQRLIKILIRPPKWGNGKTITPENLTKLLGKERQQRFLRSGIIRPVYSTAGQPQHYQMTAPGYLMWERRCKGPILELSLHRLATDEYSLSFCAASDLHQPQKPFARQNEISSWRFKGNNELVKTVLTTLLNGKNTLPLPLEV